MSDLAQAFNRIRGVAYTLIVLVFLVDMYLPRGITFKQAEDVRRIDKNARQLFDLITMVLDLNRLEAGRLPVEIKRVRAPDFLRELEVETQGLQEQSGLEFLCQVLPSLPVLYTDSGKLKVVLKNLLGNAAKFTRQGCVTV
jgi:signal transduction histidine kinase